MFSVQPVLLVLAECGCVCVVSVMYSTSEQMVLVMSVCAGGSGQVAASSCVGRPVQCAVQQPVVMSAAGTSTPMPVCCPPPTFPTIQQALLGAATRATADQPATSSITTTASVVPDPAVVKTLLASKLARNMTHQQQIDVNSLQGTLTSASSVPSSSSVAHVSASASAPSAAAGQESRINVSTAAVESAELHGNESNGAVSSTVTLNAANAAAVSTVSAPTQCLANGHAKPSLHDPSMLMNGICSPAPSCSSEDQEPPPRKVPKSPGYGSECDGLVVNGDVVDNEVVDDDDDDVSELNDCDDVLEKAMKHADIIDCGGRPAVTDNSCDDDSRLSADFLSGFVELAEQQVSTAGTSATEQATGTGSDSETAAAVADLLHETGMMADDEGALSGVTDNCLSFDFDARVVKGDNKCTVSSTDVLSCLPTDDQALASADVDNSPVDATVLDDQLELITTDVTEQTLVVKPEPQLVGPSTGAPVLACSSGSLSSGAMPAVSSVSATAQLQNGVMVVPPRGISLPSGQFISGGTRLLIRPVTSVSSTAPGSLTHSSQAVATQSADSAAGSVHADVNSPLPVCSATSVPPVRFVSSTTSQGQLVIQRAQILPSSSSSPMIQRVFLPQTPRPVTVRSEGLPAASQTNQQMSNRPVLLTQPPFRAGQLHVAGPGMQLVSAGSSSAPAQIVLQSGHVISVQPHQPSTHNAANHAADQLPATASSSLPVLAAKPSSDQSATSQASTDMASAQPGMQTAASIKPPLRPLMSTAQQPIQIVGAPLQLRAGLVGMPPGTGNAPVILQRGGRPILFQSPNVGSAQQHPSNYVVFRPGPLPVPSLQEHSASAVSSSVGSDMTSRKRPLLPSTATVTRSMRKKSRKDEDHGLPFICEWSGCQR